MENKLWYAVMEDIEDSDWSCGSYDIKEAKEIARRMGENAFIAVIEEGNDPICIEEIKQEDF